MIYGNMIYEQQFNSLIDNPLESLKEFYENEISILNSVINEANDIALSNTINANYTEISNKEDPVKQNFVKKIIEKIKEMVTKFIEWSKKLIESAKNFFLKDSAAMIKDLEEAIKNIQKAETFKDIRKYASKIGRATKYKDNSNSIIRYDAKDYLEQNLMLLRSDYEKAIKGNNNLIDNMIKDIQQNNKLSDKTFKNAKTYINDIKKKDKPSKISNKYFIKEYKDRSNSKDLNRFKEILINFAKEDIACIYFIDDKSKEIIKYIEDLKWLSQQTLQKLKSMKNDINAESITLTANVVNITLNRGKYVYQEELKLLSSVKNLYRITNLKLAISS